jgi:precorrin-6x reductase
MSLSLATLHRSLINDNRKAEKNGREGMENTLKPLPEKGSGEDDMEIKRVLEEKVIEILEVIRATHPYASVHST